MHACNTACMRMRVDPCGHPCACTPCVDHRHAGAREVVLLDREPLALACALMSARASGLQQVDGQVLLRDANQPRGLWAGRRKAAGQSSAVIDAFDQLGSKAQASGGATGGAAAAASASAAPAMSSSACTVQAALFDWSKPVTLPRFDVVLACDVLYESDAVDPIAAVVPKLLKSTSGLLLLADPPNRTAHNRERFLRLLQEGSTPFAVDECYEQRWVWSILGPTVAVDARNRAVAALQDRGVPCLVCFACLSRLSISPPTLYKHPATIPALLYSPSLNPPEQLLSEPAGSGA